MATAYPYTIPLSMYKEQRQRLSSRMKDRGFTSCDAAILQGASEVPVNSTDVSYVFRQDSYFEYLFGYSVPDCMGAILADGTGILFIPRHPASFAVWMGALPTPEQVTQSTGVEECYYVDELSSVLAKRGITTVHTLRGVNTDSSLQVLEATFEGQASFTTERETLFTDLTTLRVYKTKEEQKLLEYINGVSSRAHVEVMQRCRVGMSQHQLESTFLHHAYYNGGCRRVSYVCICGTGQYGAVLHYPNNDAPVEDGTMALLDMGGEYRCYASDITCSFPVNGKFSPKQKAVYTAVLDAHDSVMRACKPGVNWVDMHRLALRKMCGHLLQMGVLRGATVDELMEKRVMYLFQPHGLGHLLGMDVHDVGGYMAGCPDRPTDIDTCKLRTARILEADLYITIEPGCYFNHSLLTEAFQKPEIAQYLDEALIRNEYWTFGGVRIESNVLITESGVKNLTCVPRTVEDIEATMSGQAFACEPAVY